jgi:hypothetical protein
MTITIISAQPGWTLAYVVTDVDPPVISHTPIIAWEVERMSDDVDIGCTAWPVPLDHNVGTSMYTWFCRDPAGTYHDPSTGQSFSDAQAEIAYAVEHKRRVRTKRAVMGID